MKDYIMFFRFEKNPDAKPPTQEEMKTATTQWQTWIKGISDKGNYGSTNRLFTQEGKTIKPNNVITDGPYAEVKEVVGGYLIVKAESLDEATELAKSCPGLQVGGSVEIRSVVPIDDDINSKTFLEKRI